MSEEVNKESVRVDSGTVREKKRIFSARRVLTICLCILALYVLIVVFLVDPPKSVDCNNAPLEEGYIVRHRVDGRIGIVTWSKGGKCGVRFACNYSSPKIYQLVECESFELILLSEKEEGNLYWRWNRREVPSHDPANP
jgi:hypothetical protein